MTFRPSNLLIITFASLLFSTVVNSLGTASTVAVTYDATTTVCGLTAGKSTQKIQCYQNNQIIPIQPNVSFEAISGGRSFFCGLRSGGFSLLCWDTGVSNSSFRPKRIYFSETISLTDLSVGDTQVCAREVNSGIVKCWRGGNRTGVLFPSPGKALIFQTITSGSGFSCGILKNSSKVLCWGYNVIGADIQEQFKNFSMSSLVAGASHVCGLTINGILVCKGNNGEGQLNVPLNSANEFSGIALGSNFTCAIRQRNTLVSCWGLGSNQFEFDNTLVTNVSFELIISGLDFVCGLKTINLTMLCWGPGWSNDIPLGIIIPGPCVQTLCSICGMYPNSGTLCDGSGNICRSCQIELPLAVPLPPISPPSSQGPNGVLAPSKSRNKLSLIFLIVGSTGIFVGICTFLYCLRSGLLFGLFGNNTNNVVQPNMDTSPITNGSSTSRVLPSSSFSTKHHSSRMLRRERSGSSSSKQADKTEIFSLSELAFATNNFSIDNKIGSGSFGVVYRGKLSNGREVAVKRGENPKGKRKKLQEKESAFDSELVLLSRLHHKHLVGLIGFCQENEEKLLVYEYMSNGSLHDHLHNQNSTEKKSRILNSWKMRIKIALEAARGIEYLHKYAVPPIIHRDIKSSNILLDSNWTAKVSDFGLSLMEPESELETVPTKAVGTVGYIDPEYYVLNVLTTKSDVYGLGVVLLELLTGKRAVFKDEEHGNGPIGVVEYAGPRIYSGEMYGVLDKRVGPPERNEMEAVELMGYTAMHCVNLEGKERPSVVDIVATLERALLLCEDVTPGSASTTTLTFSLE